MKNILKRSKTVMLPSTSSYTPYLTPIVSVPIKSIFIVLEYPILFVLLHFVLLSLEYLSIHCESHLSYSFCTSVPIWVSFFNTNLSQTCCFSLVLLLDMIDCRRLSPFSIFNIIFSQSRFCNNCNDALFSAMIFFLLYQIYSSLLQQCLPHISQHRLPKHATRFPPFNFDLQRFFTCRTYAFLGLGLGFYLVIESLVHL